MSKNVTSAASAVLKVQSTPDNSNLQGKSIKVSSYREFEENSPRVRQKTDFTAQ